MSNEQTFNLNRDILFLGKKIKFSNETTEEQNKKNKYKIYKNKKTYLSRPITYSEYFNKKLNQEDFNFNEKEYIYQNFDNSKKDKNEIIQSPFCFICGIKVEDKEHNYLINPLQKLRLINELKKLGLILSRKKEGKSLIEEKNFTEVRLCKNCLLTYFKILKPFLKQEYENNIQKMKNSQIESPIKKEVNLSDIYNNNYSNRNKNIQLLNNNIQNNMNIKLNDSNRGINSKSQIDNFNNFSYDTTNIITKLNENNIINDDINKNRSIPDIKRNYMAFLNYTNNKALNPQINNNNFYSNISNLNSNDIRFNLNKSIDLNNNLNFVPQKSSFIHNSSNNNINQFNNINNFQNFNQNIENNSFINNTINDNLSTFLNNLDILQKHYSKNINQNNILFNDNDNNNTNNNTNNNNDTLNHILYLITKYLFKIYTLNNEIKLSMINDIENLMNIFSKILSEIILENNYGDLSKKLNRDIDRNNEIKKKDEKIEEDKRLLKENSLPSIDQYYDLFMKAILKTNENFKCKLNVIKIYDEIKNEFILTLFKNIEYLYNFSQNIIQNQENNLLFNEINKKIKKPNNESNSNCQFNGFSKEIMDNLYQTDKIKNNQELLSLLNQINQANININFNFNQSDNIPSLFNNNNNLNRDFPS